MPAAAARRLAGRGLCRAIGYEATAQHLSRQLGVSVPLECVDVRMKSGNQALLLYLLHTLQEGAQVAAARHPLGGSLAGAEPEGIETPERAAR